MNQRGFNDFLKSIGLVNYPFNLYTAENDTRISTQVPTLTGLTITEARQKVKEHKLNIKIEGTEGKVVSQEPQGEKSVEEGSVVDIVVQKEDES